MRNQIAPNELDRLQNISREADKNLPSRRARQLPKQRALNLFDVQLDLIHVALEGRYALTKLSVPIDYSPARQRQRYQQRDYRKPLPAVTARACHYLIRRLLSTWLRL